MIENITDTTRDLLNECKRVGYKIVTVLCSDERVPKSVKIKDSGYAKVQIGVRQVPRLICGHPEQRGEVTGRSGSTWPKMWGVIKDLGLNNKGAGWSDCFPVRKECLESLTPGCYDLALL